MMLTSSTAGTNGGVFYFDDIASVNITSCEFTTISSSSKGSIMYSVANTMKLIHSNNDIKCLSSAYVYSTNL